MKKLIVFFILIFAVIFNITAQTRGQSLNGSTGLFTIPTGRIGWEDGGNIGLDVGYRAIINNDAGVANIPAVTLSLFNWIEISGAFDIQPEINENTENNDLLFGVKFRLPTKTTACSIGASTQIINLGTESYNAYQPYLALTYPGTFFNMKAETTIVFGKTFYTGGPENNSNIDFGMGFDLVLFPDVFGDIVHWIIDFSNYSYSDNGWPNNGSIHSGPAWNRGVLNLGFRIDLSEIPAINKYKVLIDFVFNDLFDHEERSFTIGAVFGLPL